MSTKEKQKLQAAYLTLQKASGIKAGDKVKVLRKASDYELGWDNTWDESMDEMVGKEYAVSNVADCGIEVSDAGCSLPFFILEVKPLEIKACQVKRVVVINGQSYPFEVVAEEMAKYTTF